MTYNTEILNEFFSVFFGYHGVALGFAIMYSPFAFTIAICYIHLFCNNIILKQNIKVFIIMLLSFYNDKLAIRSFCYGVC